MGKNYSSRTTARFLLSAAMLLTALFFNAITTNAQFTPGRLVVLQVGDGTAALTNAATPVLLKEFTTAGTPGLILAIPTSGVSALTLSGTATSEGLITRSSDGNSIIIPGYNAVAGTLAISGTATTTVPRAIGKVTPSGVFTIPVTTTSFSANNPRGAASDGANFWGSGANTGIVLESSGTGTIVTSTVTNNRALAIYNSNLYFSTGSGTRGIYQVGTGLPTTSGNTSTLLFSSSTTASSPYQFAFNSSGTVAYVADDATGIYKWTFNGTAWSSVIVNATTCRGLVVDFSGTNPVIYATTAAGTSIIKITDTGSGYPIASTTIASASANTAFRGLAFTPEVLNTNPSVNLSVSSNSGTEAGTTVITVTATASSAVTGDQTVNLGVSGTNITGGDYTLSNTQITILNGATTGSVTFTVADDALIESTETAILTISNPSTGILLGTTTTQNITITDNDSPVVPAVNLSVSTNSASEAAATIITLTATASSPVTGDQTVDVAVSGTNITAGDYTLSNTQISILNGATTGSVTFTVTDDAVTETTETAVLTLSSPTAGIALGTTISQNITIIDNDIAITKINSIQGSGLSSPLNGSTQTIEGIVTVTFPGSVKLSGFYVQEEDADADGNSATSEGIFVYDPTGIFSGNSGDKVRITGTVSEFTTSAANIAGNGSSSLTEITVTSIVNLGTSTLPSVTNVILPVADFTDLERYEGMLVNVSSASGPLTVTETFKLGRYGQVGLSGGAVLNQYTQVNPPSVSGYTNYLSNLQDNYIILDDGSSVQNPDPEIFARGGLPLSASNTLRGGDNITGISGVLDHRYEGYRVQTTTPANFVPANPRPALPPVVGGTVKASFFNVLNYFTDLDLNNTISIPNGVSFQPRGANTATEFTRQRDKIIAAITTINADVIGVSEMENDGNASLQNLVNGLNAVAGAGTYAFINDQALVNDPNPAINAVGTDAIKVAIIYKPAVLTPVGSASSYLEPTPANPVFSRPPVAQTFITSNGIKFSVIVNHFKSKGSSSGLPGDSDQGDGQGFSNATRVAQSLALLSFINTVKTASGDDKVLVIGDLNAYALEDPITTLTDGGLVNLLPNTSYSYQFNGQWGSLDHALASSALSSFVAGAAKWHINSDEPVVLDYNTEFKTAGQVASFYNPDAFRSSDHDPVIVGLNLAPNNVTLSVSTNSAGETGTTTVTVTATATSPVTGNQTVSLNVAGTGITVGDYTLSSSTITIPDGTSAGSVTFTVVNDALLEGTETAVLTISNPSAGITLGTTITQNITISDNEADINLCNYVRIGRYDLPEPTRTTAPPNSLLAQEVSGVTYNWDTETLFVVGDGGTSVVQVSKTGQLINSMTLAPGSSPQGTDFYDPEGITYIGNGKFVMTEERDRNAVLFTYVAGSTLTRANAQIVHLGTFVQNIGLEGLSYDPITNGYIFVKETQPQGIFQTGIDFNAGTATNGSATTVNSIDLFDPALAGLADFADVFALSNLPVLNSQPNNGNLLVLSQESGKIVNISRSGAISSSLTIVSDPGNPLTVSAQQHEGLTMDRDGILYVVSENGGGDFDHPQLWVYAPSTSANQAPTAITLSNTVNTIAENTSTTSRIKVADINVTDDGLVCNNILSLGGADAGFFEISGTELFLKAGTVLDFETKSSYSISINVDDPTLGSTPDATISYTLTVTDVLIETPPGVTLIVSEVAPWSSGNSPVAADWFELTNTGTNPVTITGWKMDDNSNSFASSVALNGITTIAAGETVIFIETSTPATTIPLFRSTWFGVNPPANLQIGSYTGSGVGLSTGGDAVNVFNANGELQAKVIFGTSPAGPSFPTFNNAIGLNNTTISTLSVVGVNDAFAAVNDLPEIGSPGTIGKLYITEVAPWSSGNSPVAADWFEVTNTKATAVNITGWKMDDNSGSPAAAVLLNGITSIAPGESVIFIETATLATTIPLFLNTWFGANPPAGLQVGSYTGSGVGLGTSGDAVNLYNNVGVGILQASVLFGTSPTGLFKTFDNAAKLNNTTISQLSAVGVNGAFIARNDVNEIGSPGTLVTPPCPVITVTATQGASISCNGGTTTVTVTVSGGTAPYTGTGTFSRTAGTYTFTVTDAYGCSGSATISISQPAQLVAAESHTAILCNGGSSTVTISATGGTAPYTGTGTFTQTAGTQSYTVTDANGCTSSVSVTVTQPGQLVAAESHTAILCNGGSSTVTISATGGTAPYSGTGTFTQAAGTQSYTVTDANGCTSVVTATVTEPTQLIAAESHTAVLCNGGSSTVTISATGGTAPYTGTGTFTQAAGTQSYTVTDANGCTSSVSVTVTQPGQLVAAESYTAILCNGGSSTVTISATGGTAPYTGTGTFTQAAGTRSYTVTDANGCTSVVTATVTEPTQLIAAESHTAVLCNGGSSTVTISATGGTAPYTGTGTFTQAAGTQSYTVTDANGCTSSVSVTVTQPGQLVAAESHTAILCNGGSSTVTISATGGTSPYTGTGTFTQTAGTQSYTVTDANGCTSIVSVTVLQPTALTVITSATAVTNGSNGTATATAAGGTAPYTYLWTPGGQTSATATGLSAGNYNVVVTDAAGCSATGSVNVIVGCGLTVDAGPDQVLCSIGLLTANVSGVSAGNGSAPCNVTYVWRRNGVVIGTTRSVIVTALGTYQVTATDCKGCTATDEVIVAASTLAASATVAPVNCYGGLTTVNVTATGGTAPYFGTGTYIRPAGTYSFVVVDSKGCYDTKTVTITQPAQLVASVTAPAIPCGQTITTVTVAASGGTAPYTGTGTFNRTAGFWSFTITDAKGCTATGFNTIAPSVACGPVDPNKCYKLIARHSGKAATVIGNSTANGANIEQRTFSGSASQIWKFSLVETGYYKITNQNSGKVLEVTGASTANGAAIQQYSYAGGNNQKWSLSAISSYFAIKAKHSGKTMSVAGSSSSNGALVEQRGTGNNFNEQWAITETGCPSIAKGPEMIPDEAKVEMYDAFTVTVLPNPSSEYFTLIIKGNEPTVPVTVRVMDLNGKVLAVYKTGINSNLKVGEAKWVAGTYIAEITQGNERKVLKLIKTN